MKLRTIQFYEETMNRLFVEGNDFAESVRAAAKVDKRIVPKSFRYTYSKTLREITVRLKYK